MPGIAMRPLAVADVDRLVELDSDPEVMRHITGGAPTPRDVIELQLLPKWLRHAAEPGLGYFAIEDESGRFLGWAHLRRDAFEPAWAEVGYRLRREAWGQGIATRAAGTLVARAFDELHFATVSARTTPDNLRSRRVMERLGMTLMGTFAYAEQRLGGHVVPAAEGVLYLARRA